MKQKKQKKNKQIDRKTNQMILSFSSKQDPEGSYTGKPVKQNEPPVQDADDL